jgi:hypothetical protein
MKKLVLASVMTMASLSLVPAPKLRAQQDISIKDPAEFNAYNSAITQSDPKLKASGLEGFLTSYPQSVVKTLALNQLLVTYQQMGDADHALSAATRLLQVDPANMQAIYLSVAVKKGQCQKAVVPTTGVASDPQPCDDSAALAQKGLTVSKAADVSADDWKKQTDAAYPLFHSTTALDDAVVRKDFKGAIAEYRTELMLLPPQATTVPGMGLADTLQLAQVYAKQELVDAKAVRDADAAVKAATDPTVKAAAQKTLDDAKTVDANEFIQTIWFYARAWNFAPAAFKAQIEPQLNYYYNKFHGVPDGLDAVKSKAAATLFPPDGFTITPAPTPEQKIHAILVAQSDLGALALADKELVLTYGSKEDADKIWAVMKDKDTPVPGIVVDATASVIKIAVTDDAKQAKVADFTVNLKTPLADKDIPVKGAEFGLSSKNQAELDGTYDTYTQIPGTDTTGQSVQIVLRDGSVVPVKKKLPVKPSPAHHPAAH